MNTKITLLALATLSLAVVSGCDRDKGKPKPQDGGAAATQASAGEVAVPRVGKPYFTKETYKPVIGKRGGRIIRDTIGEPKSFNPVTSGESSTTEYAMFIFDGLTKLNPFTFEIDPLIAESWTMSEDGLVWTFKLRKDVVFNDGSSLKASDVLFSIDDLVYDLHRPPGAAPRFPNSMRDILTFNGQRIKTEVLDDYTVRMILPMRVAIFDHLMSDLVILPEKVYGPFVKNGSMGGAMGTDSKSTDLVGTGPFMLGEYVRGQRITLKRNPSYWRKDKEGNQFPYLDELVTQIVSNTDALVLDFERGQSDYVEFRSGKEVAQVLPKQANGDFTLYQLGPGGIHSFVCFNMNVDAAKAGKMGKDGERKVKWFRDQRFRQAVAHGIDRRSIVNNILRTLGHPISAPYTAGEGRMIYKEFKPYTYDPAKAKALLAEMGLKDRNGDGIIEDEDGYKVSFTLNTNSGNKVREEVANFVRTDLAKLGMDVNTLFLEFNLLIDKIDNTFDWECLVFSLTGSPDPHWGSNVYKSDSRLHMWWPYQKTPSFDWEKRIDEIFLTGIQEMDKDKRKDLYREFVQIMYEQQPFIYTAIADRVIGVRNRIGNFFPPPYPNVYIIWHNIDEMYIR
jgi:peptide/nickel transport system substrate-binding protein